MAWRKQGRQRCVKNFWNSSLSPTDLDENKKAKGCEGVMSKRWVLTDNPILDLSDVEICSETLPALRGNLWFPQKRIFRSLSLARHGLAKTRALKNLPVWEIFYKLPMAGVEPARGVNHARFWVWCVYQFRHIGLFIFDCQLC